MPLTGATILVVDDELDLATNLQEILEDEGATVSTVSTAQRARELIAGQNFDIALIDVQLPDGTGLSLLPDLERECGERIEVLLITGNASLEDAIEAVKQGAYAYVLKPFDPDDLIQNVARAFSKIKLQDEAESLSTALKHSETSLRTLVDTVQALLLVLDDDGHVLQANPAVSAAVGVPREQLLGVDWIEEFVLERDREQVRARFHELKSGQESSSHENRIIHRDQAGRPDGSRWVRWQAAAVSRETGEIRIYASGLDVTEVRDLEQRTRIAEKLAAVGTLSAGLAHEIRNPLNGAALQLQLLTRRCQKVTHDERITSIIGSVQNEIDRLTHLVEDFLSFARPTQIRAHDLELDAVVRHVVELEQPRATEKNLEIAAQLPPQPVGLRGDQGKLEQVILNLVRNAIEAGSAGGHIWIRLASDAEGAHLEIEDDGPGIPPENLDRIFEPFFSTKEAGTGLGMAICHSLVNLHGGELTVQSRHEGSNRGTSFKIQLPFHPPGDRVA